MNQNELNEILKLEETSDVVCCASILLKKPEKSLKIKYIIKSESKRRYFSYDRKGEDENQCYTFKPLSKIKDVVIFDTKEDAISAYEEFFGKRFFDSYVPVILEIIVLEERDNLIWQKLIDSELMSDDE